MAVSAAELKTEALRHQITAEEYELMAEAMVFEQGTRVELIEGEILDMSPIGSPHVGCGNRLNALLSRQFGQTNIVSVQNPIRLGEHSEPAPDVALLRWRNDFYKEMLPAPSEVFLLVEVADSSLAYDRGTKLPLYAEAMIAEVWIANLRDDTLEIHALPAEGKYRAVRTLKRGESFTSDALPGVTLNVEGDIL